MNILIEFSYNDKHYVIYTDDHLDGDDIFVKYGIKKESAIFPVEDPEDVKLLNEVYRNSLPSKNMKKYCYLYRKKYHGCDYEVYYDKKNDFKIFLPLKDGERKALEELSFVYNNVSYSLEHKQPIKDKIYKIIKVNGIKIGIYVSAAALSFSLLSKLHNNYIEEKNNNVEYVDITMEALEEEFEESNIVSPEMYNPVITQTITIEDINNTINSNPNITKEEKTALLVNPDVFLDNVDMSDGEYLIEKLKKFKICYEYETEEALANSALSGRYVPMDNRIDIFCSDKLDDNSKMVLYHEFCHLIGGCVETMGTSVIEGINEQISQEYFYKENPHPEKENSYLDERMYVRLFNDLVGPEVLRQCYITGSVTYLVNALKEMGVNENEVLFTISLMDENNELSKSLKSSEYLSETISAIANNNSKIYERIKNIYGIAKGIDITEDYYVKCNFALLEAGYMEDSRTGETPVNISDVKQGILYDEYINIMPNLEYNKAESKSKTIDITLSQAVEEGYAGEYYLGDGSKELFLEKGLELKGDRVVGFVLYEDIVKEYVSQDSRDIIMGNNMVL